MGIAADYVTAGLRPRADVTWHPLDHRWYEQAIAMSDSGVTITPEVVTRCSTVLAAVRWKANSMAMATPVKVFRRTSPSSRALATDHYAARLMRRPNAGMTAPRWMRLQAFRMNVFGNAYSRIWPGPDSFAGSLRPIHPTRIRPIDETAEGELLYEHLPADGPREILAQSEVLHFRGISADGKKGLETYQLIQQSVGIALAAEKHVSSFMKHGARLSGVMAYSSEVSGDLIERAAASFQSAHGGPENSGRVFFTGEGKFTPLSSTMAEAQFMELRDFQVQEILRHLGVPGVVVGYQGDKASTYKSAEVFFESGGLRHTLFPDIRDYQEELGFALLPEDDEHFFKFPVEVLDRINTAKRYEAHQRAILSGWKTPNEVRAEEDLNPGPDELDDYWRPVNVTAADEAPSSQEGGSLPMPRDTAPPGRDEDVEDDAQSRLAKLWALDIAARLIRQEQRAARKELAKTRPGHVKDLEHLAKWSERFYEGHAEAIADQLRVNPEAAQDFAREQREELAARGEAAVDGWLSKVPRLAALALGEE